MGMGMGMEMGVIIGDPASSVRRGSHSGERIDGGGGAAAHRGGGGGGGGRGWNPGGRGAQSPPLPNNVPAPSPKDRGSSHTPPLPGVYIIRSVNFSVLGLQRFLP